MHLTCKFASILGVPQGKVFFIFVCCENNFYLQPLELLMSKLAQILLAFFQLVDLICTKCQYLLPMSQYQRRKLSSGQKP